MNAHSKEIANTWREIQKKGLNFHVGINWTKLEDFVKEHEGYLDFKIPSWHYEGVYPKHDWVFAAYQLLVNCFNSSFNIFEKPDEKYSIWNPADEAKPFRGAFALDRCIYARYGESIIQSRDFAEHIFSPGLLSKFFGGINLMPCVDLKQKCGEDFIFNLAKKYSGNPLNILEEAMVWDDENKRNVLRAFNGGRGLVEILSNDFPVAYGSDVHEFIGRPLHFNKRAQLVAVLLHGRALDSHGILPIVADIKEVGPIADYEIPRALRHLEIFKYSEELSYRIDNWIEVPRGSRMELEIRAASVAVVDAMLQAINSHRINWCGFSPINICHLDYLLWKTGRDANSRPHITRTSDY